MSAFWNNFKPRELIVENSDQDLKIIFNMMSRFVGRFASVMYLLVILTGPSSAWHGWQPPEPVVPTYPSDPQDPYYEGNIIDKDDRLVICCSELAACR